MSMLFFLSDFTVISDFSHYWCQIIIELEEHSIEVHNSRRPLDRLTLTLTLTLTFDCGDYCVINSS